MSMDRLATLKFALVLVRSTLSHLSRNLIPASVKRKSRKYEMAIHLQCPTDSACPTTYVLNNSYSTQTTNTTEAYTASFLLSFSTLQHSTTILHVQQVKKMQESYTSLTTLLQQKLTTSPHGRIIVGLAGPPGSGKSTIATHIAAMLNTLPPSCKADDDLANTCYASAVSIDGFHLTRRELAAMPNAVEAFARRGAPWTFDVDGVVEFVQALRMSCLQPASLRRTISAPSFDHALKDPVPDSLQIRAEAAVILLEHNYLLLDQGRWQEVSELLDVRVFIQVDELVAQERVARRHLLAGIEPTMEAAVARFRNNDAVNGRLIRQQTAEYDVELWSV